MNKSILIGRLVREPELKSTTSGLAVCTFTIAVNRRSSGEKQADFIPIVAWRQQAENCAKYLDKGSQVAVEGSIQTRNYEAKDGTKRYVTEIIAHNVEFLSKSNRSSDSDVPENDTPKDILEGFENVEIGQEEIPF